ncbi:DNA/RNA non-specific endonuclease [Actinotalea solisilvae]|uniref:DNA/RNA non-specific endonuclease n=1 Tax=Actinotalea solisilvae TaxID=2072922 RepID=UPI0018F1F0B3|nr:DNA/RNA non-specific endonuclease [Actinotalea solisilvae]
MARVANGRIDTALLTPVPSLPGAFLTSGAATAWEAVRAEVRRRFGWTPAINGRLNAYRPFAEQERLFRQRYTPAFRTGIDPRKWDGNGVLQTWWRLPVFSAAAVPGTSNHGLGITVDVVGLKYRTAAFDQFEACAHDLGWTNAEGRSINEAWHWTHGAGATFVVAAAAEEDDDMVDQEQINRMERMLRDLVGAHGANNGAAVPQEQTDRHRLKSVLDQVNGLPDALSGIREDTRDVRLALSNALPTLLGATERGIPDPQEVAEAVADAIPDDIAGTVLALLAARLDPGVDRSTSRAAPRGRGSATERSPAPAERSLAPASGDDRPTHLGYDPGFLAEPVPLPTPADGRGGAAPATVALDYVHFTVLLRPDRRLAAATAVNVDGARLLDLARGGERWRNDRRVPSGSQAGAPVYQDNDLDRGHLVRRMDPVWGDDATAAAANEDTFHYTNAAPQVAVFNQSKDLWLGLEDYVLEHADRTDTRLSVLSGPVLADDDPEYRGVLLPRRFWKVAVWAREDGLGATGYLLDQSELLAALLERERRGAPRALEELGAYRTFQVSITSIAETTGLDLGPLPAADRLPAERGAQAAPVELRSFDQVVL